MGGHDATRDSYYKYAKNLGTWPQTFSVTPKMHDSLHRRNFTKLPLLLRTRAAAAVEGSLDALVKLSIYVTDAKPCGALLLPVFFAGLNATDIPRLLVELDAPFLDSGSALLVTAISRAYASLGAISYLLSEKLIPASAFGDLWPRTWSWIHLLDTHREAIIAISPIWDALRCFGLYASIIVAMSYHPPSAEVIDATDGVRVVLVRSWAVRLRGEDILEDNAFLSICGYISSTLNISVPRNLEEAIEGAGGTRDALASLIVEHITRVLAQDSGRNKAFSLSVVVQLLAHEYSVIPAGPIHSTLHEALLRHGIVAAMTSVVGVVSGADFPSHERDNYLIEAYLLSLVWYFKQPEGYHSIAESLKAGLLSTLVACGLREHSLFANALRRTLDTLSTSLVYRTVLMQVYIALPFTGEEDWDTTYRASELSECWSKFGGLIAERLKVLNAYEGVGYVSHRACDNVECGAISTKTDFRRCSRCQMAHYCSESCQIHDWKYGMHRESCQELQALRRSYSDVSPRDRSFLRAVMHDEYIGIREALLPGLLNFARVRPDETPCILFDFTRPDVACDVTISPAGNLDGFANFAAQVRASGGRMQLHMMKVVEGGQTRRWIFPLRSSTADVMEALQNILRDKPMAGGFEERRRLTAIGDFDILEIH
ncbi:hypothetical protein B0H11DRAFT_2028458 [Mycena galericulata]|nr:hypothetical protein B0H11DRAFT_2028458 [Mycena galericulata]